MMIGLKFRCVHQLLELINDILCFKYFMYSALEFNFYLKKCIEIHDLIISFNLFAFNENVY